MINTLRILKLYTDSFKANVYTLEPFRMIGLIDVSIEYSYGIERVTLAYYRSSGTYSGKIKGLWYPIVGIKTHSGEFTEFTKTINHILKRTTRIETVQKGWLAKSLFFSKVDDNKIRGYSNGAYYPMLLETGEKLRGLYDLNSYQIVNLLDAECLNQAVFSNRKYPFNNHTQRENYETFIKDIYITSTL